MKPDYEIGDYVKYNLEYASIIKGDRNTIFKVIDLKYVGPHGTGSEYKVEVIPEIFCNNGCSSWFKLHKKGKGMEFEHQLSLLVNNEVESE